MTGRGKTVATLVIPSGASNLALRTTDLRDSVSSRDRGTHRNEKLDGFFCSLQKLGAFVLEERLRSREMMEYV